MSFIECIWIDSYFFLHRTKSKKFSSFSSGNEIDDWNIILFCIFYALHIYFDIFINNCDAKVLFLSIMLSWILESLMMQLSLVLAWNHPLQLQSIAVQILMLTKPIKISIEAWDSTEIEIECEVSFYLQLFPYSVQVKYLLFEHFWANFIF